MANDRRVERVNKKLIVDYYNKFNPDRTAETIDDIPSDVLPFIILIDHEDLAKPFIKDKLMRGTKESIDRLSEVFQVTRHFIHTIGRSFNVYK